MALVAIALVAGTAAYVGALANRHSHKRGVAAALALAQAAASTIFLLGILMLIFNGYVEDSGSPEVHSLDEAIPTLAAGVALTASLYLAATRSFTRAKVAAALAATAMIVSAATLAS